MTSTATLAQLHRAAFDLASDNRPLSFAASNLLSSAVGDADDTYAGQDVEEEMWSERALRSLELLLCYEVDVSVRNWFLAQGFTF